MQQPFNELSAFLQSLPEPHILFDTEYRIISVNPAFKKYCNSADSAIGRTCYEVSHGYDLPCDHSGETCPLRKSLESGKTERVLHMHQSPEGEEYVSIVLTPIKNQQKETIGFVEKIDPLKSIKTRKTPTLQGQSPAFQKMMGLLRKASSSDITVLLEGETGAGKKAAAHFIHETGLRCTEPFIVIDCPTLTEANFQQIFYGTLQENNHRKPLKTKGIMDRASGGTLFLNEISELSPYLQTQMLHFLDSDIAHQPENLIAQNKDIRIIASSQQKLKKSVDRGLFRKDLYYRLNKLPITIPPLRERQEDITILAESYLKMFGVLLQRTLSPEALLSLEQYSFPGNIRELRNIIERAYLLSESTAIKATDLLIEGEPHEPILQMPRLTANKDKELLERFKGNRKELARYLGISERTLYRKLAHLKDR